MDIQTLSARFGVNAERRTDGGFPVFENNIAGKRVLLVADETTAQFLPRIEGIVKANAAACASLVLPSPEPVADEESVALVAKNAQRQDYLLAVGAGTINDLCKYAGFLTHTPSGVFATAPSMDGFTSGVTPLIEKGFKITRNAQTVSDILMDFDVLRAAPRIMIGAGVGDILAKYCCLADWRISSLLTGEKVNEEAFLLMLDAVRACDESIPQLLRGEAEGVEKLMDALLISGYAMVIAGNSRPASGAEHHMSHFLEMDFLRRGERIPLHGVKVGLGTMVSLYLYKTLSRRPFFPGCEAVYAETEMLPAPVYVENILSQFGCPTRFSQLGVARETVKKMFSEAYKIRDRFTVLTLYCTNGWMTEELLNELLERFY